MQPEPRPNRAVGVLIGAVVRRRWWRQFAFGVLGGAILVSMLSVLSGRTGSAIHIVVGSLAGAGAVAWAGRFRSRKDAASVIERVRPSSNLVITAEELERHPERTSDVLRTRIAADASNALADVDAGDVIPHHLTVVALIAALAAILASLPASRESIQQAVGRLSRALPVAGAPVVRVTVDPPAYSGRPAAVLTDPTRIEALEGSRISFELPPGWRARFGAAAVSNGHVASASGYFAIEPPLPDAQRRLVPLNVTPDRAPAVRIGAPAKDLLLPDGSRTIPILASATDDLALQDLELRYTKVSGSGEQFEFTEGALPVRVARKSAREWTAEAQLALESLQLGPGDALVYRAVARDRRPADAGFASSDTYFVEIAGPGQVALEGVEMPPEMERYAMSQQMIVLKLERLRQREAAMTRAGRAEEAASMAAEQRTVRANFIFLLGGHVEDEEEEAAQSHEIQEGRLENTARRDINAAIAQMTRAEQGMTAVDFAAALPPARAAVESLQRAFGRSRYLLRALAVRSRVDPSRRLTGDVTGAADWRRVPAGADVREGHRVRELLTALIDAAPRGGAVPDKARLQQLAESAMAIDPSSSVWQEVARTLLDAKDSSELQQLIVRVSGEALRGTIGRTPLSAELSDLERAFEMERRR